MNNKALFSLLIFTIFLTSFTIKPVYAATCIETIGCLPTIPTQVLQLWDIQVGQGTTLIMMALILGSIEIAIYLRTKSLAMLTVMGFYTIAAFGTILTSPYISAQYHTLEYVLIFGGTSVFVMMVLKLVKE